MIGQTNLLAQLNSYTYETLPKTMLFVGPFGCGKHTVVGMLSTKFKLNIKNISNKLTYEQIVEFLLDTEPYLYLIDKELTLLEQNSLLKFIEEPPITAHIVILTESTSNLLETVTGRCQKFVFEKYSKDELLNFTNDENLLEYLDTPGEIITFSENSKWAFDLCDTILTKINFANIPNILTISDKFNFGKDDTKFEILVFMKLLLKKCFEYSIKDNGSKYLNSYLTITEYFNKMKLPQVDKKKLFELCLLDVKQKLRYDNTRAQVKN